MKLMVRFALLCCAWVPFAAAHTTATGLAEIVVSGDNVSYRLNVVLTELPQEAQKLLGDAANGQESSVQQVADALRTRVRVRVNGADCRPGRASIQGSRLGDGKVALALSLQCPSVPGRLEIREEWFELFGEHYRTLARIEFPGGVREAAFLPEAREVMIESGAGNAGHASFVQLGVEHILTGADHLLFVAALLIRGGGFWRLIAVITAFTVAHSFTLALAVLGVLTVPPRIVEPLIAVSIVWVAVENLLRVQAPVRRWAVSFVFGLVHGLGFASALQEISLPRENLAWTLFAFNAGVEIGQMLVVAVLLPGLLWLRARPWEPRFARFASLAVAITGIYWLVERLFFARQW